MRASKYNAALLAPLAQASRTMAELLRKLGLEPSGGNYRYIARALRVANVNTDHFRATRWIDVPVDQLEELVRESKSVAQVLTKLNRPIDGRPHRELTKQIRSLGLDTSHFPGTPWSRGQTKHTHPSLAARSRATLLPDDVVFVENSRANVSGPRLAERLVALGRVYECEWCGLAEWRGKRLVLHVDHINGINNDNRIPNLRLLCPNCHSQTPTYGNRRR
jgi:hypothetical protein